MTSKNESTGAKACNEIDIADPNQQRRTHHRRISANILLSDDRRPGSNHSDRGDARATHSQFQPGRPQIMGSSSLRPYRVIHQLGSGPGRSGTSDTWSWNELLRLTPPVLNVIAWEVNFHRRLIVVKNSRDIEKTGCPTIRVSSSMP